MKQLKTNNKYLEKVREELNAYQAHLLDGTELTPDQWATWHNISSVRAWLREGFTDTQAMAMLKNSTNLQDRRVREILALAYGVFVELRQSREKEGVKELYSEMFRDAARKALEAGDFYNHGILLDKAAKIDGAYENQSAVNSDTYKKPSKVIFKVKQVTVNNNAPAPNTVENATYQIEQ